MDCRTNCLINAIIAAVIGAVIGFFVGAIIACLIGAGALEVLEAPAAVATGGLSAIIAALVGCGLGTVVGTVIAIVGALLGAAVGGFGTYFICVSGCNQGPAAAGGISSAVGEIGTGLSIDLGDLSCAGARAATGGGSRAPSTASRRPGSTACSRGGRGWAASPACGG